MSGSASSHPFTFFRGSTQIYPEQPKLRFASRDADILELRVPSGTLAGGDSVEVKYNGVRVFKGDVARRRVEMSGNSDTMEAVTVEGPWAKMARFVYRQLWNSGSGLVMSSRLVLNQTQAGNPQSLDSELLEVATAGASACGYTVAAANVAVSSQVLPSDECRDITVADAIRRELRLFPKAVCRFDYSGSSPALLIKKSGDAASYAASVPKTARTYDYDERPIDGVDLEIEAEGEIDGVAYRNIGHQTAGNTAAGNVNCLRVALQIRGFSSNTVRNTFKSVTEAVPLDLNNVGWWKQKHHRLPNVPLAAIKSITDGTRSPSNYSRISAATAGELEAAGLHCEVSKFSCKVRIETEDDKEEDLCLVSHFLTTNAQGTAQDPKTYTWVESSDAESGETVPSGLAAAILAERSGSLRGETMTIRLGDTFPKIGDICDGIPLQSFEVDCADLTASLAFGAAEHLSPEDMAALLSNFRNKCTTHSSTVRKTGKADDGGSKVEHGGIPPLSSTEFAPGTKSKTTIKSSSGGGSFVLDSAELSSGESVAMHEVETPDGSTDAKIFASGDLRFVGGEKIDVEADGNTIKFSYNENKEEEEPCEHPQDGGYTPIGGVGFVPGGARDHHTGDDDCNCN